MAVGSTGGIVSVLGIGAVPVSPTTIVGDLFSGGTIPAAQQVVFSNGTLLTGAAGFTVVGTPSATAPNTGTNGPGLLVGVICTGADGGGTGFTPVAFGNGSAQTSGVFGYASQGTAASPGATIAGDTVVLTLRGHDGTNFTSDQAGVRLRAMETWSPTSRACQIRFTTTNTGATSSSVAGIVDQVGVLAWGGANNGDATYSGGTNNPRVQTLGNGNSASIGQSNWSANASAATHYFAKSRSSTIGTHSVITTGDTLGTVSFQGDDGTNFVASSQIVGLSTGTIGTGQVPGLLRFGTATSGGTMTTAAQFDAGQNLSVGNFTTAVPSTVSGGTVTPRVFVLGTSGPTSSAAIGTFVANANAGSLYFTKSRSGTIGTMTVVTTGDTLGTVDFQGSDGTNFVSAAQIGVTCTGTIASTRVPGNLVISTGTDAAPTVMTAALTINNVQQVAHNSAVNATTAATGGAVFSGGIGVAKNIIAGFGVHEGVASTVTAAGTTTLTNTSVGVQIFTGSTTQNLQMPAANLFGAGVSVMYTVINRSSGTVTALRAGSDTFNAAATTFACTTLTVTNFYSDGVSAWYTK